jgi:hypothetical protein
MHGLALMDFRRYHEVIDELEILIRSEPDLSGFVAVAAELTEQARQVRDGSRVVPPLSVASPTVIPTRELAVAILGVMSKLPSLPSGESKETRDILGYLLGNLAQGITRAIYKSFPDAVPGRIFKGLSLTA